MLSIQRSVHPSITNDSLCKNEASDSPLSIRGLVFRHGEVAHPSSRTLPSLPLIILFDVQINNPLFMEGKKTSRPQIKSNTIHPAYTMHSRSTARGREHHLKQLFSHTGLSRASSLKMVD